MGFWCRMLENQEQEEVITVRVQDPRVQNEGSWNSYVDYKIFLHTNSKAFTAKTSCVRRRYREFVWLRKQLQRNAGLVPVPELPGKSTFFGSSDEFIEKRRQGLQHFLENCCFLPRSGRRSSLSPPPGEEKDSFEVWAPVVDSEAPSLESPPLPPPSFPSCCGFARPDEGISAPQPVRRAMGGDRAVRLDPVTAPCPQASATTCPSAVLPYVQSSGVQGLCFCLERGLWGWR
ncbi:sorting nexin-11 isoform X3 [Lagenorhynchus albirostris]|uniref:sorting nexin-11 isoform X3 n=1 Tax=Lagenorhynchus albirostris TaxID=27610 RepID=UPI0028E27B49|nr:sorting nexin-11 isoform X3 [Lagenorhynchus albirostris]